MKKSIFILSFVAIFAFLYACKFCKYQRKMEKKNEEIINGIYFNKGFKGIIKNMTAADNSAYEISMTIDTEEEFDLEYAFLCIDENFKNFVNTGDSLYKKKGDKLIKIVKPDGRYKIVEFKFCK